MLFNRAAGEKLRFSQSKLKEVMVTGARMEEEEEETLTAATSASTVDGGGKWEKPSSRRRRLTRLEWALSFLLLASVAAVVAVTMTLSGGRGCK